MPGESHGGEPGRMLSTGSQSQTQLKQLSMYASTNENIVFSWLIVYGNGSRRKSSPSKIIKCTIPIFFWWGKWIPKELDYFFKTNQSSMKPEIKFLSSLFITIFLVHNAALLIHTVWGHKVFLIFYLNMESSMLFNQKMTSTGQMEKEPQTNAESLKIS